jgi:hypothetical protein
VGFLFVLMKVRQRSMLALPLATKTRVFEAMQSGSLREREEIALEESGEGVTSNRFTTMLWTR